MATGTIILPINAATPDNTNPPIWTPKGTSGGRPIWSFNESTDQIIYWSFRMPVNYASGPVLKIQWSGAASTSVTHDVIWGCQVMAMTPDVDGDMSTDSYDTANTVTDTILGTTSRRIQEASLTLTNADSVAANDYVALKFYRDADAGGDDLPEAAWLWAASLEYTTT